MNHRGYYADSISQKEKKGKRTFPKNSRNRESVDWVMLQWQFPVKGKKLDKKGKKTLDWNKLGDSKTEIRKFVQNAQM